MERLDGVQMTVQVPKALLTLLLTGVLVKPVSAQHIENVVGAPFTATTSYTSHSTGKTQKVTDQIARAADGSTYHGYYDPDGRLRRVEINDLPNNRKIAFFANTLDHSYTVSTPPDGKFTTRSTEEVRKQLRRIQSLLTENPDNKTFSGRVHHTSLGEKSSDGMLLFGFRHEIADDDGEKYVREDWRSDLGIVMSSTSTREEHESSYVVTNIRQEEPDPSLFRIPKEYLSDPLLDANTVFIENHTGSQEVLDAAVGRFNSWKKRPPGKAWIIVEEKNTADVTAAFTRSVDQNSMPGIRLQIYLRDSGEPVFEVVQSPNSGHDDELAAMRCLDGLWSRQANTHVGQRSQGKPKSKVPPSE
jgi:hypothetical protein